MTFPILILSPIDSTRAREEASLVSAFAALKELCIEVRGRLNGASWSDVQGTAT